MPYLSEKLGGLPGTSSRPGLLMVCSSAERRCLCVPFSCAFERARGAAPDLRGSAVGIVGCRPDAVSDPEVMLRLAERPADVVLADTALTRPDSVGFVRRVLARAPQAAVLLLGAEESEAAAATIGAGARGLIQGSTRI